MVESMGTENLQGRRRAKNYHLPPPLYIGGNEERALLKLLKSVRGRWAGTLRPEVAILAVFRDQGDITLPLSFRYKQ